MDQSSPIVRLEEAPWVLKLFSFVKSTKLLRRLRDRKANKQFRPHFVNLNSILLYCFTWKT
jgi:hypothetical protein